MQTAHYYQQRADYQIAAVYLRAMLFRVDRRQQMKTMRTISQSLEHPRVRAAFEQQTFVHKYIALLGTVADKAKAALRLRPIGEFYHVQLKSLPSDGYSFIMDLAACAYGVAYMAESKTQNPVNMNNDNDKRSNKRVQIWTIYRTREYDLKNGAGF